MVFTGLPKEKSQPKNSTHNFHETTIKSPLCWNTTNILNNFPHSINPREKNHQTSLPPTFGHPKIKGNPNTEHPTTRFAFSDRNQAGQLENQTPSHHPIWPKLNPTEKKKPKNLTKERHPIDHGKNKKLKPQNQNEQLKTSWNFAEIKHLPSWFIFGHQETHEPNVRVEFAGVGPRSVVDGHCRYVRWVRCGWGEERERESSVGKLRGKMGGSENENAEMSRACIRIFCFWFFFCLFIFNFFLPWLTLRCHLIIYGSFLDGWIRLVL